MLPWQNAAADNSAAQTVNAPVSSFLLDMVSATPIVAFSTRKLRAAYSGYALQLERSSDSTTTDIGFDGSGNLDTTTALSFVGAGNGTIVAWYDQSGNSVTAAPISPDAGPTLIASGVLQTINSKAAPMWSGSVGVSMGFILGTPVAQPFTVGILEKLNSVIVAHNFMDDGTPTNRNVVGVGSGPTYQIYSGVSVLSGGTPDTSSHGLIFFTNTGTGGGLYVDATAVIPAGSGNNGPYSFGNVLIGNSYATGFGEAGAGIDGSIPEYLAFVGDIHGSADQTTIRSSWTSYWGTP